MFQSASGRGMSHRHGAKVDALLARKQSLRLRAYDPMEVRAFGPLPAAKTGLGLWPKTRRAGNDEPWTASVPKAQLGTGSTGPFRWPGLPSVQGLALPQARPLADERARARFPSLRPSGAPAGGLRLASVPS